MIGQLPCQWLALIDSWGWGENNGAEWMIVCKNNSWIGPNLIDSWVQNVHSLADSARVWGEKNNLGAMQLKIIYFLVKILYSYLESLILYLCVYLPLTCLNVTLCPAIAGALVPFSLKTQPTQHSVWDEKNDFSVMQIKNHPVISWLF